MSNISSKELRENLLKVNSAKKADRRIRACAYYAATKGMTVKASHSEIMKLFTEMKIRLLKGSWKNISQLQEYVTSTYGVPVGLRD